jgi:hypothetical protein
MQLYCSRLPRVFGISLRFLRRFSEAESRNVFELTDAETAELEALCAVANLTPVDILRLGMRAVLRGNPAVREVIQAEARRRLDGLPKRGMTEALRDAC